VAYRVLASGTEADDAVQEAWLRLQRADVGGVENVRAWLTTVVARVSLDMLRSRQTRREEPLEAGESERIVSRESGSDPEREALLAESVGLAMLVVLDRLSPAERLAFVLHDMFALPFDEIAGIVECSPVAARQLASRARRRVQETPEPDGDFAHQREVAAAFLAASRDGDFEALLRVLDPDVVLRVDAVIAPPHGREVRGARKVAAQAVVGRKANASPHGGGAQIALIDGKIGLIVAPLGKLRMILELQFEGDKITAIHSVADAARLRQMELSVL
jgi:RNA polymerase sigma-70 factor (ECF subfamily)